MLSGVEIAADRDHRDRRSCDGIGGQLRPRNQTQGIPARVRVPGLNQKLKLVRKRIPWCVLAREVKARASGLRVAANSPGKATTIATDVNGPGGWDGGDWRARQWWGDTGDLPTVFGVATQGRKSVQWAEVQRQG